MIKTYCAGEVYREYEKGREKERDIYAGISCKFGCELARLLENT
jgi:hypothetical protein